jgi:hypothetical protein
LWDSKTRIWCTSFQILYSYVYTNDWR